MISFRTTDILLDASTWTCSFNIAKSQTKTIIITKSNNEHIQTSPKNNRQTKQKSKAKQNRVFHLVH